MLLDRAFQMRHPYARPAVIRGRNVGQGPHHHFLTALLGMARPIVFWENPASGEVAFAVDLQIRGLRVDRSSPCYRTERAVPGSQSASIPEISDRCPLPSGLAHCTRRERRTRRHLYGAITSRDFVQAAGAAPIIGVLDLQPLAFPRRSLGLTADLKQELRSSQRRHCRFLSTD
jgi:hypothetical protein